MTRPSQWIEAHTKPGRHAYNPDDAARAAAYILELETALAASTKALNRLHRECSVDEDDPCEFCDAYYNGVAVLERAGE